LEKFCIKGELKMKFENTSVFNFEGALRGMRDNFIYALRGG